MWSCFVQYASKAQTALESEISGPLFGACLEHCSSNSVLIFYQVVLPRSGCFQNSNSARICDFRHSFLSLFRAMFRSGCFQNPKTARICDFRPHFASIVLLRLNTLKCQTPLGSGFLWCVFRFGSNFPYNSSKTQTALGSVISGSKSPQINPQIYPIRLLS